MDVPLEILDREIAVAHGDLAAARARLLAGEVDYAPNPLAAHRRVSSRATRIELADATGSLAAPVRLWVEALTLERVSWPDTVRIEAARRDASIKLEAAGVAARVSSPRDLVLALLVEAAPKRQRVFADALARGAAPAQDAARIHAERRAEAARLLGASCDVLEIPVDPPAALATAASRFLADTAALVDRAPSWAGALGGSVGRAYAEGWPARLTNRWLYELFGGGPLTEGLRLAIPTLPRPLGAASFARALGAFGEALADADRVTDRVPWTTTRSPFDLRGPRRGALFAALAADPIFAAGALGLGRGRARDQARGVARALLVSARLSAARVLSRGILRLPAGELAARFEESTGAALGVPIPTALAGVVPRLGPSDPSRFVGLLVSASDRRSLIERFDEDWYRSPHAALAIREEDASLAPSASQSAVPAAALDAGVREIVRTLGELT